MARAFPDRVEIAEGPIFMERTEEDGPQETYRISIVATVGKREFALRGQLFRPSQRWTAQELVAKIEDRGSIDLAHWEELEPRLPLEERFAIYAQQEAEVRAGCRPEWDLYHGV